jgi:flavin-dependent dehydrogenase
MSCEEDCERAALKVHRLASNMAAGDIPAPGVGLDADRLYDLVIVGAGPAGLTAAIRARALGLDVVVLERLPSPKRSHHPDGGIIQARGLYTLSKETDGLRIAELDLVIPNHAYRGVIEHMLLLGPAGACSKTSDTREPRMYAIVKDDLVACLASRAQEMGARIVYNTRVRAMAHLPSEAVTEVVVDAGQTLRSRLAISAEGCTGKLAAAAGAPVNEFPVGWAYSLLIEQPPLPAQPSENGFVLGNLEQLDEDARTLSFWATTSTGVEFATGPMFFRKRQRLNHSLDHYLEHLLGRDGRLSQRLGVDLASRPTTHRDGCRVFARRLPRSAVADGMIAVGDAIASSGMLLNLPAMKTGELAAEVAAKALAARRVEAATLREFDQRALQLAEVKSSAWMNGLLIEAPLRLDTRDTAALFSMLEHLNLDKLTSGGLTAAMSLGTFMLRNLPALLRHPQLRCYLDGSGGPALS